MAIVLIPVVAAASRPRDTNCFRSPNSEFQRPRLRIVSGIPEAPAQNIVENPVLGSRISVAFCAAFWATVLFFVFA